MEGFKKHLSFYYSLPNFQNNSILSKAFNVLFAKLLKLYLDRKVDYVFTNPNRAKPKLITGQSVRRTQIIASLTSFPARIRTAHISIEGIFSQAVPPDRIMLWLAKEQFPNLEADLPSSIMEMKSRGLEIYFCDEDLRSHKKYYFAIQDNPDAFVVTFDDDLYYHPNIIQNLLELHKKFPRTVIATRTHKMLFKDTALLPYSKWIHNYNEENPSLLLMHTSGAGTLFTPDLKLDDIFFDKSLIMKFSPKSDDVWMKINLIRLGIPVVTNNAFNKDPISVKHAFSTSLVKTNSFEGGKDEQLKKVIDYFNLKFNIE